MLVAYFGETDTERCGVCDYCLERNKSGLSDLEIEDTRKRIRTILEKRAIDLHELVLQLRPLSDEKSVKVIELLLDNEEVIYLEGNLLSWNER
ncbi:MAG: RecQ family zinc-binding domain-containing protein [Bacteroidia bacterium]